MTGDQALIISRSDENPETLRARFQDWGYLYIKNYVSKEKCCALLNSFMRELKPHIRLDAAQGLPILTGKPFVETDPVWDEVYPKIQSLEEFHRFFHDKHILDLMKKVSNADVFVYPMKMARISTPGRIGYETPPHQDARSHAAGPTMAGIWIALHDISAEMGRLKILPRSHTRGVRPVSSSPGVGNVQCEIYPEETSWHVSDVAQGDVIIFHSCTVHAAQPNNSDIFARLSVDTRFCDYGAPVSSINLDPHHGWRIADLDWQKIYNNWQEKSLQYYWKNYPNLF
jgi:ectoine hydroxylase-related dioxygenase (phytanoyl-CoA dioxygenase family)